MSESCSQDFFILPSHSETTHRNTAIKPLHDITQPGTVILNEAQWKQGAGVLPGGQPVVPVSIDSYLGRHLRPHQVCVVCVYILCTDGDE